jgi:hypothetical protein
MHAGHSFGGMDSILLLQSNLFLPRSLPSRNMGMGTTAIAAGRWNVRRRKGMGAERARRSHLASSGTPVREQ